MAFSFKLVLISPLLTSSEFKSPNFKISERLETLTDCHFSAILSFDFLSDVFS